MSEHLTREQVAALIDDSEGGSEDLAHIQVCEACAREFEQMSRMRMALSALPKLEPPAGEWELIESRLPAAPGSSSHRERRGVVRPARGRFVPMAWPMQAAAVLMLFVGGLYVGSQLGLGDESPGDIAGATSGQEALPVAGSGADSYLRAVSNLEALRDELNAEGEWPDDPAQLAERLSQFDALLAASKEALQQAPTEPALNDFVFGVADQRNDLANRLDESLRLASVQY